MHAVIKELKKIAGLSLFFLIGFGYILLLMKLLLKDYSITFYIFSKAVVGALVAAKAVIIMDSTPLMRACHKSVGYIRVLYRTAIYTIAVLFLGLLEHLFHAYRETGNFSDAVIKLFEGEKFYHLLGSVLGIGLVFMIYNILRLIEQTYGKGTIQRLFFGKAP
jgi:hypothetical protein